MKTTIQNVALMLSAFLVWLSFAAGGERSPLQSKHEESVKRQHGKDQVGRVVEIRSYNLKPGTRNHFHELFVREALPLLQRWKVDVVAYGPSLHDDNSYFLMRAYSSIDNRQKSEDAFYESDEWWLGPREAILANIESYTTIVIRVDEATLRGLRRTNRQTPDETRLKQLNVEYVQAFMGGNVRWYEEHLAEDFVCIEPDGSLLNRSEFLRLTAKGPDVSEYRLDRVRVRMYGDMALVQATGLFTRKDGSAGKSRYIDVYVRNGDKWKVVSAQITRTWDLER